MVEGAGGAPIRLGLIGCGWISDWHGRAAASTAGIELVACCDVREDVAREFAGRFGCERAYGDIGTMLRDHELDAILLATWPTQHREQILVCLEGGIRSILCEKSLAPSPADAMGILAAAWDADALIVEGLMWRHHPVVRKIDDLIGAGELGELDSVSASFDFFIPETASPDDPSRNWRQQKEHAGGVPWDITCYCVDACNRFAGALPRDVTAVTSTSAKYGTVDRLHGLIEYENGLTGVVSSSLRSNFNYGLQVNGSAGQVVVPNAWRIDTASDLYLRRSTALFEWETQTLSIAQADPYQLQLERFVATIRGQATPDPPLAQSAVNALTVAALVKSGSERSAVRVAIPDELVTALAGAAT